LSAVAQNHGGEKLISINNKKEKIVNTNETLDGVTAGFIAAIANGLSRDIGVERMRQLIRFPQETRMLLSPLVKDEYIHLLPSLTNWILGRTFNYVTFYLHPAGSSNPPTMRRVMREAYERKFALLSGGEDLCQSLNSTFKEHRMVACFPFLGNGQKLRMYVSGEEDGPFRSRVVELDLIDESLLEIPIFFKMGADDRSDCFKC
jgi:hypothetical protein